MQVKELYNTAKTTLQEKGCLIAEQNDTVCQMK